MIMFWRLEDLRSIFWLWINAVMMFVYPLSLQCVLCFVYVVLLLQRVGF